MLIVHQQAEGRRLTWLHAPKAIAATSEMVLVVCTPKKSVSEQSYSRNSIARHQTLHNALFHALLEASKA